MIPRKELKVCKTPHDVNDKYNRFPVTKQAFVTVGKEDTGEVSVSGALGKMFANLAKGMASGQSGYSQLDNALDMGGNAMNLLLGNYGYPNSQFLKWEPLFVPEMLRAQKVDLPPEELTDLVKKAAQLYGSDLTGIAKLDPRWVYSQDLEKPFVIAETEKVEETDEAFVIPKTVNRAIVIAVSMDVDMMEDSPKVPASTATSLGYSRMGITAVSLAEYIRGLGYTAIPCMNDTALSIPLAIDAGLGQLGRHGLLITPEFGSNIRLAKVLTDMPLTVDEPIDFGIIEFCENCFLCAQGCPPGAIGCEGQSFEGVCENNNPGVKKWFIHAEKCLKFWQANGASCANCITVCPFTYGFESEHCVECEKCTSAHCPLHRNTDLRIKYGYLKSEYWGMRPEVLAPRRRGL